MLAILELSLETAIPSQELGDAVRRAKDRRASELLSACSTGVAGGAESEAALAVMHTLRGPAGSKAYVLDALEATMHRALGQLDQARERLTSALAINPFLAGAYKDLGDIYLQQYLAGTAWTCWEAARRIEPAHAMLAPIGELEATLVRDYPDFF